MKYSSYTSSPVVTITATGFATTIAQILVIRELLVLFYGNEISTGLIFACWLLWTALGSGLAGRLSSRFPPRENTMVFLLLILALMLPLTLYLIRTARIIFAVPLGELPTVGKMMLISLSATGLFCPLSGALFGVCWAARSQRKTPGESHQPLAVYLGEALGAATGGLVFYYLLFPYFSALSISLCVAVLMLIISGWNLRVWQFNAGKCLISIIWFIVSALILSGAVFGSKLETRGRHLQWGKNILAVHDTPYHNIAIMKDKQQVSVFANGLWLFSTPDKLSAEHAVHDALLQHENPKTILLISGGIAGHIEEILKHPDIQRIDYVEPDPALVSLVKTHLRSETVTFLQQDRLHIFHGDAATFIRGHQRQYDVILMNMGDPINAEMNRFYTEEFFKQIARCLLPGGVFSFSVSGGEEMMGHVQARFVGAIRNTLSRVFPNILIIPGDHMRFIATDDQGELTVDVVSLTNRISERELDLSYIREDTLRDMLNPFRLDYLKTLLAEFKETAINKDFSPICYFHTLMLWAFQWHPRLESIFSILASIHLIWFWSGMVLFGLLIQAFFWTGPSRFKTAISGSIMVSGAMEMVLQVVLLLTFQVLEGFVYLQLALIIAFYMAGLGLGAGAVSWWEQQKKQYAAKDFAVSYFIRIQALFSLFPILFIIVLSVIHGEFRNHLSSTAMGWIFSGLSFTGGFLGGVHFALAVLAYNVSGVSSDRIGGVLYALDLTGAGGGVLIASFFIIPVYGLINTLILLSVLSLISLLTLLRHP